MANRFVFTLIAVFLYSGLAQAQPIDVKSHLNAALRSAGVFPVYKTVEKKECKTRCCGRGCDFDCDICETRRIRITDQRPLSVSGSVEVVRVEELEFGELVEDDLPGRIRADGFRAWNCSSAAQSRTVNLTVSYSRGSTVTVSRSITNAGQVGVNVSYMGVGLNASVSRSVSLSNSSSQQEQQALSKSESVTQQIPPMTELWATLKVVERSHSVPFRTRVLVDSRVSSNAAGKSKASQVLHEAKRTFATSGLLSIVDSSDAVLEVYDRRLTAEECGAVPGASAEVSIERFSEAFLLGSGAALAEGMPAELIGSAHSEIDAPAIEFATEKEAVQFFDRLRSQKRELGVEADTPSFAAAGTHQCQSSTDIGHTCQVSGLAYSDCNEAYFKLKADDCCPATRLCAPDPRTGEVKCQYGGTSIGFWIDYCVPY